MANKIRGEFELKIDDKTYKFVPTVARLIEIEDKLNIGLYEVMMRIGDSRPRLKDVLTILHCSLESVNGIRNFDMDFYDFSEEIRKVRVFNDPVVIAIDILRTAMGDDTEDSEKNELT